jgi:hypothetical protein
MPSGKWCLFAWTQCLQDEDDIEREVKDPWAISQSDELYAQNKSENEMINAWTRSKSRAADLLKFKHASLPSTDQIYVHAGTIRINRKELVTSSLICCCAIGFTYAEQNFLAHVTPGMNDEDIISAIDSNFNVYKMQADANFRIVMWCGSHRFKERAQIIVKAALEELRLDGKLINATHIDGIDEYSDIGVNLRGTFCKLNKPKSWKSADAIIVRQNTMIVSENELLTDRFFGCSALGFTFGGKNFLALVDNGTRVSEIKSAIVQNFDIEKLKADDTFTMVMWTGAGNQLRFSERTIKETVKELGLTEKLINKNVDVRSYSEVGVNVTKGPFCEEVILQKRISLHSLSPG